VALKGTDNKNRKVFSVTKSGRAVLTLRSEEKDATEWMEAIKQHIKYACVTQSLGHPPSELDLNKHRDSDDDDDDDETRSTKSGKSTGNEKAPLLQKGILKVPNLKHKASVGMLNSEAILSILPTATSSNPNPGSESGRSSSTGRRSETTISDSIQGDMHSRKWKMYKHDHGIRYFHEKNNPTGKAWFIYIYICV
jgi:hypothetical protein